LDGGEIIREQVVVVDLHVESVCDEREQFNESDRIA
jgi:hypothetical protein